MARRASLFIGLLAQAAISATASPPPNAARLPTSWAKSSTRWGSGSSPRSTLASRCGNWEYEIDLLRVCSPTRWSLISFRGCSHPQCGFGRLLISSLRCRIDFEGTPNTQLLRASLTFPIKLNSSSEPAFLRAHDTRLDRVSSPAGIDGPVYAAFSHTCSPPGIVPPPFGKATSGAVSDVRLTQGAMASLDIAGLGYLIGSHRRRCWTEVWRVVGHLS
jgi:hypothetical protein